MPPKDEVDAFMSKLLRWCKQEHGRAREMAKEIGVAEQVLSNWMYRRKTPKLYNWLALQKFAKEHNIK
jgi:hypothetical protein